MSPLRVFLLVIASLFSSQLWAAEPQRAIFATGCFWCTESDFEKLPGVIEAVSGFTGGAVEKPSYKQVVRGNTGHTEAVELTYHPDQISYRELAEHFWRTHDPLDNQGQFCDRGASYRPGLFYLNEEQKKIGEQTRDEAAKVLKADIKTEITAAGAFWPAEDYHQDYYKTNALKYRYYRFGCGRDKRISELWGKADK